MWTSKIQIAGLFKGPSTKYFCPSYRLLAAKILPPTPLCSYRPNFFWLHSKIYLIILFFLQLHYTNHGALLIIATLLENLLFGNADEAKSELNISLA